MKNLAGKLALLKSVGKGSPSLSQARRARSEEWNERLVAALSGQFEATSRGDLFVLRRSYPLAQKYGQTELQGSLSMPVTPLAKLYRGLENFQMRDTLFFDTETTGLAGGSGTYAFLVGIGFFEEQKFVTEQLLMRDYADEPALLEYFHQRLRTKSSLVSFNGRTFDAQLLSTRYSMHRLPEPFEDRSHLDLLHLCRRLWGLSSLPDCRLETLESRVLGAPRHGDVPGWLIPSLFFDFLRDKNPLPLKGVIEHNRRDLLAMVALCSHLTEVLGKGNVQDPHLALGLARLWAACGETEKSHSYFERALKDPKLDKSVREKGLIYWARELKKNQLPEQAALLWRRVLIQSPQNLEATVELAKWLEHQRKDYRSALVLVEGGLRSQTLNSVRRRELEHRAGRLRKRLCPTPREAISAQVDMGSQ